MSKINKPENLAQKFHETYERLAPKFNYNTREESAVPWNKIPENNKNLMIAVCDELNLIEKSVYDEAQEEIFRLKHKGVAISEKADKLAEALETISKCKYDQDDEHRMRNIAKQALKNYRGKG